MLSLIIRFAVEHETAAAAGSEQTVPSSKMTMSAKKQIRAKQR